MAQLIVQEPNLMIPPPRLEISRRTMPPIFVAPRSPSLGGAGRELPSLPTSSLSGGELRPVEIGKGEIEYVQHRDAP